MMGDYNLDFFTSLEREKLETVILPNGFSAAGPTLPTRICETVRTHIDFILMKSIPYEIGFDFDSHFKTDHFGCALFTDITVEKLDRVISHRFEMKKYHKIVFCKTLSDLPWFKVYQGSTPSDMFYMFFYFILVLWKSMLLSKKYS